MTEHIIKDIPPSRMLRYLADTYEQAQRMRIQLGERIRAVIQERDNQELTDEQKEEKGTEAEGILKMIRADAGYLGPVPMLGRTYHRYNAEEEAIRKDMMDVLKSHEVWHWINRVKGIGPTLAAKILARFDPTVAPYCSSFWKYAGLSTVPGTFYKCQTCGLEASYVEGYNVTGKHKALRTTKQCKGALEVDHSVTTRVAQPRAVRGERRSYDAYAKKTMYLVATSFLKAGGPYEQYYRRMRSKVADEHRLWPDGKQHYWALRKVQKLFLSHLWEVWRKELALLTPAPYAMSVLGHEDQIDPWEMVEPDTKARKKAS